ncbi:MAG: putative DNA binding domain-containing protein [Firmicutes bacterium]|nr:putative DNA binding domain-containing protein [Bacillota bacterium]
MFNPDRIEDLQYSTEKQIMDRKSARIDAKGLAVTFVAMANADGGYLGIGIEDDGTITGIDAYEKNINEIQRIPYDYCIPSVKVEQTIMDVTDKDGKANHVLRMHIFPSSQVVANQQDEVFLRVGDKSKKLNFEQRLQLVYAKGMKFFEDQPVAGATIDDIDQDFVRNYCERIGYTRGAEYYLRHNHDFVTTQDGKDVVSGAAILLFGKNPQKYFPRARVRFIRYEGTSAEVGSRMNIVKDQKFSGRILDQLQGTVDFVKTQIREYTKLGEDAVFNTTPEYPEFCWTELIVNAVAHRDYSIKGTDIQIKMFDDHFQVESPGILPGLVRINNIREFHFSRNPKIVELLTEYEFVKELGEGVDRVYRDMDEVGLPEPEYRQTGFMLSAVLKNKMYGRENMSWVDTAQAGARVRAQAGTQVTMNDQQYTKIEMDRERLIVFCEIPRSRKEMMKYINFSSVKHFREDYIKPLLDAGRLFMTIPDKPNSPKQKYCSKKAGTG